MDEARERAIEELEAAEAENGERSHTLITDDDLDIDWSDVPEEQIKRADVTPENFGRIAAQTAKQVILQRIREAERAMMYDEYVDRVSEVVTGIVQQAGDRNNVLVDLGKVEALLPRSEQVDGERYEQGSRIKAVITEVRSGTKGPQVILSRRDPELIQHALRARGPGDRRRPRRDPRRRPRAGLPLEDRGRVARPGRRPGRRLRRPAGLARPHGRLRAPRREDRHHPVELGAGALRRQGALAGARARGARRRRVQRGDRRRPRRPALARDRQGGAERRLAARLTGWKVDIQSETEFARAEADAAFGGEEEEFSGRCVALLSTGKRCPNTALPGSHYCGIPAHREIAEREAAGEDVTAEIVQPEPESEERRAEEATGGRRGDRRSRGAGCRDRPAVEAVARGRARSRGRGAADRPQGAREAGGGRALLNERAGEDVRRLRPQSSAGRAGALRRAGRDASARPGGACRAAGAYTCTPARRASSGRPTGGPSRARCGGPS